MKKTCALLIVLCFFLSACSAEGQVGYKMLSDSLREYDENYAFEYFDLFIYEHTYHTYLSLCAENDVLLSMQIDERGNVNEITVTADKDHFKTNSEREAFKSFASAVIACYTDLTEKESRELQETLSYDDPNEYFTNLYERYSSLRYHFIFSSNSEYIFLDCEYYELMENETK